MKKIGVMLIGALMLSGCASGLSDSDYYELVRETDGLSKLTDENISGLGENICGVFDTSETAYTTALATLTEGGVGAGAAGALIALSVNQYCPEHLDQIPG